MTFGERLLHAMEIRDMKQSALATTLGRNQSTVSRWIPDPEKTGRLSEPDRLAKEAIAKILRVNPVWLIEGRGDIDANVIDIDPGLNKRLGDASNLQDATATPRNPTDMQAFLPVPTSAERALINATAGMSFAQTARLLATVSEDKETPPTERALQARRLLNILAEKLQRENPARHSS